MQTDSDWAGYCTTRNSTPGGVTLREDRLLDHWSNAQQVVALSSGEAELNASAKCLPECIGALGLAKGLVPPCGAATLQADASAVKGMLLRQGCGKVTHLTTRQVLAQKALQKRGTIVQQIPRELGRGRCLDAPLYIIGVVSAFGGAAPRESGLSLI